MNNHRITTTARHLIFVGIVVSLSNLTAAQSPEDTAAAQLTKIQSKLTEITKTLDSDTSAQPDQSSIRSLVQTAFELQMKIQQMRIAKAESDLQKVKQQFEARKRSADTIIANRVAQFSKQVKSSGDDTVPASVLAAEGWRAWQKRDWRTALTKFQASVKKDDTDATR